MKAGLVNAIRRSLLAILGLGLVHALPAAEPKPPRAGELDCVLNPSVVADLGSGVPGIVSHLSVDRSDFVSQGDILAELESGVEQASYDLAAARAGMDAEVALRRVNAGFGRRQHKRSLDLFERKVISTNDIDARETEARLARLELQQAIDNKTLAELEKARAEEVLKRRRISSPIKGVVMDRFVTVGEYVEDQPVVRVAQLDPLHVEVYVPVERLGEIQPGMSADVWSDAIQGSSWQATVSRVDRVADVASGTYGVRLVLPNPDYKVPAGLRCRLNFAGPDPAPLVSGESEGLPDDADTGLTAVSPESEPPVQLSSVDEAHDAGPPDPPPAAVDDAQGQQAPVAGAGEPAAVEEPAPAPPSGTDQTARLPRDSILPPADVEPRLPDTGNAPGEEMICASLGPFDSEGAAGELEQRLLRAGLNAVIREQKSVEFKGYRIVSDWFDSRQSAQAFIGRLKATGFTDFHLTHAGAPPVRVALGLFNKKAQAEARQDLLRTGGFGSRLLPWKRHKVHYALQVSGRATLSAVAALRDWPDALIADDTKLPACGHLASR